MSQVQLCVNSVLSAENMKMPVIGLGTWQANEPEEIEKAVNAALECGYRHIDTAFNYRNEAVIGEVLEDWFKSGRIKREDVFITTKLPPMGNRAESVEKYLRRSLKDLRLSYVDLYLIHIPVGYLEKGDDIFPLDDNGKLMVDYATDLVAIWKEMERQVRAGRARAIGLSNFNATQVERIVEHSQIKPANVQVELHAYCQSPEFLRACRELGITVTAYSPLGSPGFRNYKVEGLSFEGLTLPSLLTDPIVSDIASKHGKSSSQVLIRFLLQLGVSVIPKSTSPERIKQNIEVFDFELTDEEMKKLFALNKPNDGGRIFFADGPFFECMRSHPEYPYKLRLN